MAYGVLRSKVVAFGLAIKTRRQTLGLTQQELADELSVGRKMVWEWETGRISPTVETIWRLANALGTTPSELFSIAEEAEEDS